MIKDDSLFQVLLKYNFDLMRGDKSMRDYLSCNLNRFYSDIISALDGNNAFLGEGFTEILRKKASTLKEFCDEITSIIAIFDNGMMKDVYLRSSKLFNKMKPYFILRTTFNGTGNTYYRIRSGDFRILTPSQSKLQKSQLFHIKKDLRSRIGAYRYSVAGFPCLYLSSNSELAWFECGMPKQFSYCQMKIEEDGENALKLIDLSNRPIDFLSNITIWLLNAKRQKKDTKRIYNLLINYILTYPLAAACSVKVKARDSKFVEEYIISQLLMQWIRESNEFDGVRYKSSLNTNLVDGMGAINVALPVKSFRDDGLDKSLTSKIKISDIGFLDVNTHFKKYAKELDALDTYKNSLFSYIVKKQVWGSYIIEIIDLCEIIKKTYLALLEGNYSNNDLIFSYTDSLYDYANLLYNSRDIKIQESIDKTPEQFKSKIDRTEMENHFEEFHKLTLQILTKHIVFNFEFEPLGNYEYI